MEPARLHVITGEVPDDPIEALTAQIETEREQRRMLERDIRGKRLQISNLESQLRDRQATDPGRAGVRKVLEYFSRRAVETGWWKEHPRFEIGDERWTAVSARQKQGRSVADCFVAIEGAFSQDRKRTKRAYVDITSVFRNNANFERAFEHGVDPDLRRAGLHVRIVPPLLLARWDEVESQADMCDCFMGEERFLTLHGPRSFVDTAGTEQLVLTRQGWRSAEIRSFGPRDVQLVMFGPGQVDLGERGIRSNWQRGVAVTRTHPWFRVDGSLTDNLAVGDSVPAVAARPNRYGPEYDAGLRHGLVFGDGYHARTLRDGTHKFHVELQGERTAQHADVFEKVSVFPSRVRTQPEYRGTATVYAEEDLKAPPLGMNGELLAGFVDGWLAADGTKRGETWKVVSISWDALDWLWDIAPLAGYIATGRGQERNVKTNKGVRSRPLRWVTLRSQPTIWRVRDIRPLGVAEVYCAVVPGVNEFVLADGILTHNCGHIRFDHDKPTLERPDEPCLVHGCTGCPNGFDDFHVRCERWLASRDELARRRMGQ